MTRSTSFIVLSLTVALLLASACGFTYGGETLPWGVDRIGSRCVWDNDFDMAVDEGANAGEKRVAVIDTGIYYTMEDDQKCYHADLAANVWSQSCKQFKYVPWRDEVVVDDDYNDTHFHGHGTHVAGIIAAVDNEIGVIGTAPKARICALKLYGSNPQKEAAAAINWAVEQDIRVISMSIGWNYSTEELRTACDSAYYRPDGALLIAAAGNDNRSVEYPANYSSVIAVGAVDSNGQRWVNLTSGKGSNFGPELEFVAPGVGINSTAVGGGYHYDSGGATSWACPHVAAVAALIFASKIDPEYDFGYYDDLWENIEVREKLRQLALGLGPPGKDDEYGYGLINAWAPNQRPLGDINIDYIVDYRDLNIASRAFGSYPGHPNWNQTADINIDRIVDFRDINIISRNYGKQAL